MRLEEVCTKDFISNTMTRNDQELIFMIHLMYFIVKKREMENKSPMYTEVNSFR